MRSVAVLLIVGGFAVRVAGQAAEPPRYAQPIAMPSDRDQDSYTIYSQLLKSGPIEWRDIFSADPVPDAELHAQAADLRGLLGQATRPA